jgi:hypothetical protein
MQARRGRGCNSYSFLTSALDRCEWSTNHYYLNIDNESFVYVENVKCLIRQQQMCETSNASRSPVAVAFSTMCGQPAVCGLGYVTTAAWSRVSVINSIRYVRWLGRSSAVLYL